MNPLSLPEKEEQNLRKYRKQTIDTGSIMNVLFFVVGV